MKSASFLTAVTLLGATTLAHGQTRLDEPPRLAPAESTQQSNTPQRKPAARLSEKEKQTIDNRRAAKEQANEKAAAAKQPVKDELAPVPGEPIPADIKTQSFTKVEQRRQGNRVIEVIVTPAGSRSSYTMQNRDGQPPRGVTETSNNLSLPQFFRVDF